MDAFHIMLVNFGFNFQFRCNDLPDTFALGYGLSYLGFYVSQQPVDRRFNL